MAMPLINKQPTSLLESEVMTVLANANSKTGIRGRLKELKKNPKKTPQMLLNSTDLTTRDLIFTKAPLKSASSHIFSPKATLIPQVLTS